MKNPLETLRVRRMYRDVFATESGKAVLKDICEKAFFSKSTFVAGDSHTTALNEGSRRLALSIVRFANISSETLELAEQLLEETNNA